MLGVLAEYLGLDETDKFLRAASYVLTQNIVHGDALKMRTADDRPIVFGQMPVFDPTRPRRRRKITGDIVIEVAPHDFVAARHNAVLHILASNGLVLFADAASKLIRSNEKTFL